MYCPAMAVSGGGNKVSESEFPTVIGPDAKFKGELSFDSGVKILGGFEGRISTKGNLIVAQEGVIQADIEAGVKYTGILYEEKGRGILALRGERATISAEGKREKEAIADAAFLVNSSVENIGARRLQTVMEKLVEDISFNAPDKSGETIKIDGEFVRKNVGKLAGDADLSKFVL